jgi:hypothetical protein
MRQAVGPTEVANAVGQVDPVPTLLHGIVAESALQLTAKNSAGVWTAQFRERLHVYCILQTGPQASLGIRHLAALEQAAEAGLGSFDGGFAQATTLV